ncbi:MAG TPA: MBL fold metallo-hydrolase [Caulobacteraceae bacterium]|nr:MBL fold metallo-hydrolase [Caulobacteraceae bacterium]
MSAVLEVTILGCGSSGGVPRADGDWGACDPADLRNRRSRCSLMVRRLSEEPADRQTTIVVDASPEFRLQALNAGMARLDAVLFTHGHADQCHGLDDIRAFALRQRERIPCWMDAATAVGLQARFAYVFAGEGLYPPIAEACLTPALGHTWAIDGPSGAIRVSAFEQDHGGVRSLGYRFGGVAYSSDVVAFEPAVLEELRAVDVWIVDALRYRPHPTHAHVDRTLGWIEQVQPKRAILTNLHIDLDYVELASRLPERVEPAYDGLRFTIEN